MRLCSQGHGSIQKMPFATQSDVRCGRWHLLRFLESSCPNMAHEKQLGPVIRNWRATLANDLRSLDLSCELGKLCWQKSIGDAVVFLVSLDDSTPAYD